MTRLRAVSAEVGIGKDTGSTQARERGECDRHLVGIEIPPGEQAPDFQNEQRVERRRVKCSPIMHVGLHGE